MKIFVHLICTICYCDLADWGVAFGIDMIPDTYDLGSWIGEELHIYRLRPLGGSRRCDWDHHLYLVNAK